ncbi:hypothetical protein [Pyrinomonas methylaliphatogenes]|uniref:HEAT repeat domain-containing protein n=1 Tax=Pyrinomonas methylaliphatogenes TaxID=454194 RepID=A0A0B6WUN3_9BACT|nr:hypothetical protein [Pyrinomonas methylaliphatogenes]CDM64726.1 hypothetical protein PYK22_00721 [Pyrinomonas methylaliphatogenes]
MTYRMMLLFLTAVVAAANARAQDLTLYAGSAEERAAVAVQRLTNKDALVRQRAAEELARLRAINKRKLVEGYRLQEKNKRVQLALDWALYRMGKSENLYAIVRALDSPRHNQAYAYLIELESPEPLYPILSRVNDKTQIRLLEVLARIGDAETLKRIEPFLSATDARIADAARFAEREIKLRLESRSSPSAH